MRQTHVYNPRPPYGDRTPTWEDDEQFIAKAESNVLEVFYTYTVPASKVALISSPHGWAYFDVDEASLKLIRVRMTITPSGAAAVDWAWDEKYCRYTTDVFVFKLPGPFYMRAGDKLELKVMTMANANAWHAYGYVPRQIYTAL